MATRLELDSKLRELLGSDNVYYNPPASKTMNYDAIRYSRSNIGNTFANNSVYRQTNAYQVTVICRKPDPEVVDKLSRMPLCRFDRYYVADNLHHYTFTLYY